MKCDYCDNIVNNDLFSVCPHCGAPLRKKVKKIIRVSTNNSNQSISENKDNSKFINAFLYAVIIIGVILIFAIILLRFK